MPTKRAGPALKWTPYIQESGRRGGHRPPPAPAVSHSGQSFEKKGQICETFI